MLGGLDPSLSQKKKESAPKYSYLDILYILKVVNDSNMYMWRELGVNSWPTFVIVGPSGKILAQLSGEGHRKVHTTLCSYTCMSLYLLVFLQIKLAFLLLQQQHSL
jgi:hypothetical protein